MSKNIIVDKKRVEWNKGQIYHQGFLHGLITAFAISLFFSIIRSGNDLSAVSYTKHIISSLFLGLSLTAAVTWSMRLSDHPTMLKKVVWEESMDDSPDDTPSTTPADSPAPPAE